MLLYEKITYEDFLEKCKSIELTTLIDGNKTNIRKLSLSLGISEKEVKRQIRLHAPQFPKRNYYSSNFLTKHIYPILFDLLKSYPDVFQTYRENCGAFYLDNSKLRIKRSNSFDADATINNESNEIIAKLHVSQVDENIGRVIEEKLHYLRSFRKDAAFRIGLFIDGYSFPICYMSFSNIDRRDKIESLRKSLTKEIEKDQIIELSRVYGCGNLPKNAISFLIAMAIRKLKLTNYTYLITAVNVNLGFTGLSMLASGFVPYALRPVNYLYNSNGFYTTTRYKNSLIKSSPNDMPPNILYVKEIEASKYSQRIYSKLVTIENGNYNLVGSAIEHEISEIRIDLEKIWDDKTRYHGTVLTDLQHPSKGQCGVSSLHLAKKLKRQGYLVKFCEGDAIFENNDSVSITNHCWVVVNNYGNRGKDVVIDLTADQNGYSQKIIFKTKEELNKQRIKYNAKSEKDPDNINVEHLLQRLEYLERELDIITRSE